MVVDLVGVQGSMITDGTDHSRHPVLYLYKLTTTSVGSNALLM